jgi:GntR family transcriptional regulator
LFSSPSRYVGPNAAEGTIAMTAEPRTVSYRTLATSLREALQNGEYADERRLPTEAELCATHAVSRQTVRRAMQELVSAGLVYRVPGRGTFAVDQSDRYLRHFGSIEDLMSLSIDTDCEIVLPLQRRVDLSAAGRLRLASDDVHSLSFVRRHDGVPFCHTDVALPPDVGRLLEDVPELTVAAARSRVTVIGLIDVRMNSSIREAEQSVTATPAPPDAAAHLQCPVGTPVLRIDRVYFDGDGRPVELAVSHFDPQRYSYRVRLRRQPS